VTEADRGASAVEADLVAHVASLFEPLGEVHRARDLVWLRTGDPSPYRNGVLRARLPERGAEEEVERLLAPFEERDLALMWWVFVPPERRPADVDRVLRAHGFELDADLPGMAVELATIEPPRMPAGERVDRVVGIGQFRDWSRVVGQAFEDPGFESSLSARAFESHGFGDDAPFRHFLYREPAGPIGASTLSLGGGVAGLANIAVLPEHRGRGIGAVVAAAALIEGRRLGLDLGVLSAGELGLPLYERLGFREVSRHLTYVRRPSRD
jgi:ribosomal protein S18 acetylase RimI-like enzyme